MISISWKMGSYRRSAYLAVIMLSLSVIVRENRAEPKDRVRPFTFIFSLNKSYPKRLTTVAFVEISPLYDFGLSSGRKCPNFQVTFGESKIIFLKIAETLIFMQ